MGTPAISAPPLDHRSIIDLFGTRQALSEKLADLPPNGVSPDRISKWWQRNHIPDEYWVALTLLRNDVTLERLAMANAVLPAKRKRRAR